MGPARPGDGDRPGRVRRRSERAPPASGRRALAERAVAAKGLENTPETVLALQKSLGAALKALTVKGTLAEGPKLGLARTWQIA